MIVDINEQQTGIQVIVSETNLNGWPVGNGGRHRSEQIHELLALAGIQVRSMAEVKNCSNIWKYIIGGCFFLKIGCIEGLPSRLIRRYGASIYRIRRTLRNHTGNKTLLWEMSLPGNLAIPHYARSLGFRIIAVPHNIEAFAGVGSASRGRAIGKRLDAEMRAFKCANMVFCISREEQWLLSLYGIEADILPYYPARSIQGILLKIRLARTGSDRKRLLILGTCLNPPTVEGMRDQIRNLRSISGGNDLPVDIVGEGTEMLREDVQGTGYKIHGKLSWEALTTVLKDAKALLVHQRAAVGALTRIPEMLLAGIPVIANPIAARSAQQYEGLYVYHSQEGLVQAIDTVPPELPPPPTCPKYDEMRFVRKLKAIAVK